MTEQFNQKQIAELQEAFMLFDKTGQGFITSQELESTMRSLGVNPSKTQLTDLINKIDKKNNKNISFPDFLSLMTSYSQNKMKEKQQLIQAFKVFDNSGLGLISASELRQAMLSLGQKLNGQQVDDMIREASVDGMINFKNFVNMMMGR